MSTTTTQTEILNLLQDDTLTEWDIGNCFFGILKRCDVSVILALMVELGMLVKSFHSRGEAKYRKA